MWKPGTTTDKPSLLAVPPEPPANGNVPSRPHPSGPGALSAQPPQALIGKSIVIKGEVTGAESLYLEGRIEGSVDLSGHYFHVGQNASVVSNITARELIIRGTVNGKVTLDDRLDIRTGGSLMGDVTAKRISIEDGAYFKGSIDMRREQKDRVQPPIVMQTEPAAPVAQPPVFAAAAGK
jgi:cytoskeletal protein CcmA (bactofilin family)